MQNAIYEIAEEVENKMEGKRKRLYHTLMSLLNYWEGHNYHMLRLDLTSSPISNSLDLRKNFRKLMKIIEYNCGYKNIEYACIETSEGFGVLHTILAMPYEYNKQNYFYIDQKYISDEWFRLTGAFVVWIKKYQAEDESSNRVSNYMVSQYLSDKQGSALVRYSYSWGRSFGFPLKKVWKVFREYYMDYEKLSFAEVVKNWNMFCRGDEAMYYYGLKLYISNLRYYWEGV